MPLTVFAKNNYYTEFCATDGSAISFSVERLLHEEQTAYQHIEIYATCHHGNLLALDSFVQLTDRDNYFYHEMLVHPALFSHPKPQQVLIIGGGDCGSLQQVLKHDSVTQVTLVEIDRRVTELSKQYFPQLCASNHDPRAKIQFADGVHWLQQATPGTLDVIIIDGTEPVGPALSLYSEQLYQLCWQALATTGILIQQSESPLLHQSSIIKPMQQAMLNAGFSQAKTISFPQPCYPSGWWSHTIASKGLSLDNFRATPTNTPNCRYYHSKVHQAALLTAL